MFRKQDDRLGIEIEKSRVYSFNIMNVEVTLTSSLCSYLALVVWSRVWTRFRGMTKGNEIRQAYQAQVEMDPEETGVPLPFLSFFLTSTGSGGSECDAWPSSSSPSSS